MNYYLHIFSPETYEAFSKTSRSITGFHKRYHAAATAVHIGDRLLCYMTTFSRWVGVLEVASKCFNDSTPIFHVDQDPYIVRFQVKPLLWLSRDETVPIHDNQIWRALSFTREHDKRSSTWTSTLRRNLTVLSTEDGQLLESILQSQSSKHARFPIEEQKYRKAITHQIRRSEGTVTVTVPVEEDESPLELERTPRESIQVQAKLASIGETMGFKIWLPRNDRQGILRIWKPKAETLLESLPLNYDDVTLKTIEQIDVLWLKGRSIVRAFEVEHTTAVYSGILRMADLMALQPNMDIKIHIVAPSARREKVFQEIRRPVFSLIERGALSELCSFIAYESLDELARHEHLSHLSDSVFEEYEEFVD